MSCRPAFAALLAAAALPAAACTTFCVRTAEGPVFGRNYDYFFGEGMVLVNPRGMAKVSLTARNPARWTAKHGSITFNQFGRDTPMGGMNEPGLVVELMELPETRYPAVDSRPEVGALEWIQYLLDNAANVEEALAAGKRVRIATRAPLHFLLADRAGDTAAIEFLGGRMVVRRGALLPERVLANSPYEDSLEYAARPRIDGELPRGAAGSLERFARAARAVKAAEGQPAAKTVEESFRILDAVAQPGHTQWQVVYDLPRATIHYRTTANRERRSITFAGFDYACAHGPRMLDVDAGRGDVTAAFQPYSAEANARQMVTAFTKTPQFSMPATAARAEAAQIETTRRCTAAG